MKKMILAVMLSTSTIVAAQAVDPQIIIAILRGHSDAIKANHIRCLDWNNSKDYILKMVTDYYIATQDVDTMFKLSGLMAKIDVVCNTTAAPQPTPTPFMPTPTQVNKPPRRDEVNCLRFKFTCQHSCTDAPAFGLTRDSRDWDRIHACQDSCETDYKNCSLTL
jgi:hypothetical protein